MQSYPKIRLFVEHRLSAGAVLLLEGDQAHYLSRVMRAKSGEAVALFNGQDGEWRASVTDVAKKTVQIQVEALLRPFLPSPDVWLCFAPIKFGRIDYLVQKATELGVSTLQPVMTQYTQSERVNIERLRANAVEAAEQCERVEVPVMAEAVELRQMLADWDKDRVLFFGDEGGDGKPAKEWLTSLRPEKWAVLIGPEGGFSEQERELLYRVPFARGVSLGPRILRADTAAITLLSLTQCWFGDWHIAPHFRANT